MKKIFTVILAAIMLQSQAMAATFGTYRPEYEYGLFDGIKFNILNKKKGEKIINVKDDVDKKIEKTEKTKAEQDQRDDEEYQMYKFMLDNTIAL